MPKRAKPTIYDVAQKASVSIATVSRVLNGSQQVRAATRRKVLDAVDALGFVPKADAVARAKSMSGQIGIISPYFTIASFGQRMRGVAQILANSPYELVIYTVDSMHRYQSFLAQLSLNTQLEGLIINALSLSDADAQRLRASQLETVLMESSHPLFCSIQIDNEYGGQLAAQHLLDKGHRQMGFLDYSVPDDHAIRPGNARLRGFRQALQNEGIELDDNHIIYVPMTNIDETRQQLRAFFKHPKRPSAIFVAADYLALYAMRIAQQFDLKVPDEIAIIGFDDLETAAMMGLTTISQSLDETGQLAAKLLLNRLTDADEPMQDITVQLHLVERETT
ncbi:MAG: LacI family DNA-binding transcriptional regulator [Anaerolineae bacterium]|nr:LacI family DNA-binding transcriptional regulator [Anaerolineae bacterium]